MRNYLVIIATILALFILAKQVPAYAQDDTFGPTCEVGVTCTPTPPAPTAVPPTLAVPVTGPMEATYILFSLGGLLLFAGSSGFVSWLLANRAKV